MKRNNTINTDIKQPNYQVSGIEPNYSYKGVQNLPFDQSSISSSGYVTREGLVNGIEQQQQFVNNYNNYKPLSSFDIQESNLSNSSNLENLRSFSQFEVNKAFETNKPIEFMPDTKNKHETLYDNLNENLLKENLKEYRLNIDSIDRNIHLHPDPFNYVVYLGPVTNSGINASVNRTNFKAELKSELKNLNKKNKLIKNAYQNEKSNPIENLDIVGFNDNIFIFDSPDAIKQYTVNLERSFDPNIIRNFINVSYVKLDCAVIPKYTSVCINSCWDFCRRKHHKKSFHKDEYDRIKDYILLNDRYIPNDKDEYNPLGDRFIQIFIKELQSVRNFGTNAVTDKSFLLIYDKTLGALYLKLIPYSATKSFKESLLGNLNKLTIQFFDSWGKPLKINTTCIEYEMNQISNTKIIEPDKYNITNIIDTNSKLDSFVNNFNEIVKCFVIINSDIDLLIPFYTTNNYLSNLEDKFHDDCLDHKTININENVFEVKDIYSELDSFVNQSTGFVDKIKISKSNRKVKLSINEYINNVIWYDFNREHSDKIISNIKALDYNYRNFGFKILDTLKTEIINLPINKNFQNFLTFLVGVWEDELNTKINYSN